MRWLACLVAVSACTSDGASCGTSEPPPGSVCAEHALADVDLNGTWTCTGTNTTTSLDPPGSPMTSDIMFTVTFSIDGCTFTDGPYSGPLDDTFAHASGYASQGGTTITVCASDRGELRFTSTTSYDTRGHPGGGTGTSATICTLTR